jgi:hypothetical protein
MFNIIIIYYYILFLYYIGGGTILHIEYSFLYFYIDFIWIGILFN